MNKRSSSKLLMPLIASFLLSCSSGSFLSSSKDSQGSSSNSSSSNSSSSSLISSISENSSSEDKQKAIDKAVHEVMVSLQVKNNSTYLDEVKESDFSFANFDNEKYKVVVSTAKDFATNKMRVDYHLASIDDSFVSETLSKLFSDFKIDDYDLSSILKIEGIGEGEAKDEGSNFDILVSLKEAIHYPLDISLSLEGGTSSLPVLAFTKDNYGTKQRVTLTLNHDDSSFNDSLASLSFSKGDYVFSSLQFVSSNIDRKENNSFVASSSLALDNLSSASFSFSLAKEIEKDTVVSLVSSSNDVSISPSSFTIKKADYSVGNLVTVKADVLSLLEESYLYTITLSAEGFDSFSLNVTVNIPKDEYQIITPAIEGFITDPLDYYTAYYETDYTIEKLFASINGGDYFDVSSSAFNSVSPSNCLIYLPSESYGSSPKVVLKALVKERKKKIEGEPVYSLEGYRIKATVGDYCEYYNPWFALPTKIVNISTIYEVTNYIHLTRGTMDFYLPLGKVSPSPIVDKEGYSPVDLSKIYKVSGNRKRPFYRVLDSYYAKNNPKKEIKFFDGTERSEENYLSWRSNLSGAVDTFNSFFRDNGLDISVKEVTKEETNNNFVYYCNNEVNYAGMCSYYSSSNYFSIYINSSTYMSHNNDQFKSTIVHELGHLLGFPDSAYAINDSLYSYANNRDEAAYFSPSDLATYKSYCL